MFTWHKTSVKGLRFRYHPTRTRKKGIKTERDVFYQYRHSVGGVRLEEGFGWLFDGMSLEKAISRVHELKENKIHGTGPTTLKAKRLKQKKEEKAQKKADEETERKNIKFSDVWKKYLAINKATKRTRKGWKREVPLYERYLEPVIGNLPMVKIAPFHFEKIKKNMVDLKLTPRTIKYALAVARQVFNYAIRNGIFYGKNPVSQVKPPESDNRRLRFFSRNDADKLLTELNTKDLDTYTMALLAFRCGLRSSEILRLTWGIIDFENEQIQILDPKNSKNRPAFMTEDLKAVLQSRSDASTDTEPDTLVFMRSGNRPYLETPRLFQEVVDEMGFNDGVTDRRQKLVFYSCRHSFASWHAAAGTDLYILQGLMGHSSFAMVQRYAHLQPATFKAAVKRLEKSHKIKNAEIVDINQVEQA